MLESLASEFRIYVNKMICANQNLISSTRNETIESSGGRRKKSTVEDL